MCWCRETAEQNCTEYGDFSVVAGAFVYAAGLLLRHVLPLPGLEDVRALSSGKFQIYTTYASNVVKL